MITQVFNQLIPTLRASLAIRMLVSWLKLEKGRVVMTRSHGESRSRHYEFECRLGLMPCCLSPPTPA